MGALDQTLLDGLGGVPDCHLLYAWDVNGMVGLTLSCDGSHYMPVAEFLKRDASFWTGQATQAKI